MSDEIWAQRPRYVTADPDWGQPAPPLRDDAYIPSRPPGAPYGTWAVTRKEPALSLLASYFVPGLGSMINGDTGQGLLFMGGVFLIPWVPIALVLIPLASGNPVSPLMIYAVMAIAGLIFFGTWVWSIVEAYRGAQAYNSAYGLR